MRKPTTCLAAALFLALTPAADARSERRNLAAVKVTALGETGSTDLDATAAQIVVDTAGTKSYGFIGLNTRGDLPEFLRLHGDRLQLLGRPGSPEFDRSWIAASRRSRDLRDAQIAFHDELIARSVSYLIEQGAAELAADPVVQAYVADIRIQYGWSLTEEHLRRGLEGSTRDREMFLNAVDASMRARLDANFRTYLAEFPTRRRALLNRIDRRRYFAEQVVAGVDFSRLPRHAFAGRSSSRHTGEAYLEPIDADVRRMFSDPRGADAPVAAYELWPASWEGR